MVNSPLTGERPHLSQSGLQTHEPSRSITVRSQDAGRVTGSERPYDRV